MFTHCFTAEKQARADPQQHKIRVGKQRLSLSPAAPLKHKSLR
jgi:hypothetical protein